MRSIFVILTSAWQFVLCYSKESDTLMYSNGNNMTCLSWLNSKDCLSGHFVMTNFGINNSCPRCVGGSKFNEVCNKESGKCAPGLICDENRSVCVLDKSSCAYTYHLPEIVKVLPSCERDGNFAAVQCKGDRLSGRCFCYSNTGRRIHGWSWRRQSKDMTCACSRLKYAMNLNGLDDNTLHCDQIGNFEELQCTNNVCWCADSKTGELLNGTRVVPQVMWLALPCYDVGKHGVRYLRQCESAAYAQSQMRKAYATHGSSRIEFNKIQCDYDGAYGAYVILNGIAACTWKDGSRLGSFQVKSNEVLTMNCFCARDQRIFKEAGIKHRLTCSGNGNYEHIQDINGKVFCVDSDGFVVSSPVANGDLPVCDQYLYFEFTATELLELLWFSTPCFIDAAAGHMGHSVESCSAFCSGKKNI